MLGGDSAIAKASTSHGNHAVCEPRSLALQKPAKRSLPSQLTYRVAPIPGFWTAPSVTIHSWSPGLGSEMVWAVERAAWALRKDVRRSSVHWTVSLDSWPATVSSSFARSVEHPGITWESTLKAPMKDRIRATVSGSGHEARAAMRCGLALKVPQFQIQPSIAVDCGLMMVFDAERRSSHSWRARKTFVQFCRSSSGKLPPQYRSAILATMPSSNRSPSTRLMSSSRAVSEPGMPMADRAYTRTPRNGVATPQYFMESRESGIW